jgi:sugar phosphate isomerase/epimerase
MNGLSRRKFLAGAGITAAAYAAGPTLAVAQVGAKTGFKVSVIADEISQDFDHACSVAANEFGMQWIEVREMWHKNLLLLTDAEIAEAQKILAKYNLRVTDIGSPLFKVNWPGAPRSSESPKKEPLTADETFKQQDDIVRKTIALAKQFKTDKVRGFDFWRIDDVTPYRAAINAKLGETAEIYGKQGIMLVLENEAACNTATGREAARTMDAVKSPHFALNWDPGNAVLRGELDAFPAGWALLPKNRIHHCHVKNAVKDASGKLGWAPVGTGYIDWTAQFRALEKIGYRDAVSLETHWKGPDGPEASTKTSWAGMKQALDASVGV